MFNNVQQCSAQLTNGKTSLSKTMFNVVSNDIMTCDMHNQRYIESSDLSFSRLTYLIQCVFSLLKATCFEFIIEVDVS